MTKETGPYDLRSNRARQNSLFDPTLDPPSYFAHKVSTIAIVTYVTSSTFAKYAANLAARQCYCARHGYSCIVEFLPIEVQGAGACYWNKLRVLEKYLSLFDWVIWLDADIVVWNQTIKMETFTDNTKHHVLIQDRGSRGLGAGALVLRNSEPTRDFFRRMWAEKLAHYAEVGHIYDYDNGLLQLVILQELPAYHGSCDKLFKEAVTDKSQDKFFRCWYQHMGYNSPCQIEDDGCIMTSNADSQVRHFTDFRETFLIGDEIAIVRFGDRILVKRETMNSYCTFWR
mmetsp:Transcript_27788/g.44527  ORF Transcript_27788/g.44527 Transcript_27788/m.44527 type:complete len:285 (+) Transcript_27788:1357-2211(+)